MVSAEYYSLVYIIIVIVVAIPVLVRYYNKPCMQNETIGQSSQKGALIFTLFMILYVGFRPNSAIFSDGPGYWKAMITHQWEYVNWHEFSNQFAFVELMAFMSSHNTPPRICFLVLATINFGFSFIALRKLFPKDTLLAVIMFFGAFGTFSFATNGIKNGCAFALFLCALAYKDNWKWCLVFLILSIGFHHSMQLSVGAFLVTKIYKKTNTYFYFWIISLLIAAAHITIFQTFLGQYTDEQGAGYLVVGTNDEDAFYTGFRLDFILYSSVPIVLSYWLFIKKRIQSQDYSHYVNTYILMNAIWMLCMYANYTNRIAQISWAIFPVILLFPFVKLFVQKNQNKILVWICAGQLSFTLLMTMITIV